MHPQVLSSAALIPLSVFSMCPCSRAERRDGTEHSALRTEAPCLHPHEDTSRPLGLCEAQAWQTRAGFPCIWVQQSSRSRRILLWKEVKWWWVWAQLLAAVLVPLVSSDRSQRNWASGVPERSDVQEIHVTDL